MTRLNTLLSLLLLFITTLSRSQLYQTKASIDFNNLNVSHLVHGDMWSNLNSRESECEFPKGSNKHLASFGALWIGGYDTSGTLRVAGQAYRQRGSDFWPGPIYYSIDTINAAQRLDFTKRWARIWKINRSTIDSFRHISSHTIANTNTTILQWPAKGNIHAVGADTFRLSIQRDLAPFVDVNGDGIYNALNGDYPLIRGEQMLWWINNDHYYNHTEFSGQKLYLEIQNSVYAYSLPGNIVFYDFKLKNMGRSPLVNLRLGFFAEMNIGFPSDDYVGMDSSKRLGFAYNATSPDGNFPGSYGNDVPSAGMMFTSLPGDNYPALVPAGSFTTFRNVVSGQQRIPLIDTEINHILRNRDALGVPNNSGRYQYNDLYMCANNFPQTEDRRFVIASNDISLQPGEQKLIGMALIVSPSSGTCPSINQANLKITADSALSFFHNPPTKVQSTAALKNQLQVYPNPASNNLKLKVDDLMPAAITLYDAVGRLVLSSQLTEGHVDLDISHLRSGIYFIHYRSISESITGKFLKE